MAMANTLQDDMAADFASIMLNTKEFAETVTFYPANGDASRSIVMHVNRTQSAEEGIYVRSDNDSLIVEAFKDPDNAKGGIPIEELESGLRPTLIRTDDFNWTQHASDQIDDRIFGVVAIKTLFNPAYASGGANTWNTSCWALRGDRPLNFTGLSPSNDDNADKAGTLISPRHVLFVDHIDPVFPPPPVGTIMSFVDESGNEHTRTIDGLDIPVFPDFGIGYLDSDLPDDVTFYKVLPSGFDDYISLVGVPVVIANNAEEAAIGNVVNIGFPSGSIGTLIEYGEGSSTRGNYWEDIIAGDSGHPTFVVLDSEFVLLGVHIATDLTGTRLFDAPIHLWRSDINTAMSDLDTDDTGYQLTTFDFTKLLPGRYVFSGDILGETPHSWTLRFIRQKGYLTGIDGRRT